MKPIIGITACFKYENYEYAIEKHGGQALMIDEDQVNTKIDGLLLPGGGDIDPVLYGEERHPKTKYVDRAKDDFEISLFNNAMEKDIPVFGICRGIQIINLAMGGSIYQHIPDYIPEVNPPLFHDFPIHKDEVNGVDTTHDIKIATGSRLSEITRESCTVANSSHHQAVKVIGDNLLVTAQSKDGIIEAMEYPGKSFVVAVQYHPERMGENHTLPYPNGEFLKHASKLFEAFIKAAS